MSQQITKWVLEFADKVTAPVKNMVKNIMGASNAVDDLTGKVRFTEKEAKEALANTQKHYKSLEQQIKENTKELTRLEKAYEKASPGKNKAVALSALEAQKAKVNQLNGKLKETEADLKDINAQIDAFAKRKESWTAVATRINQTSEIISKVSDSLSFATEIKQLENNLRRMTGLSGDALHTALVKSKQIADVYKKDANEVAIAAHAMTEQLGGTFDQNLDYLEQGLQRGADINGTFIDQMQEYAPKIKEAGLTIEEGISLIIAAQKKGIYADKAIDSYKEATQALREMDQAQKDALQGIGLAPSDIEGKTAKEAIALIADQMKDATTQAKQKILADIFKGAGEDAGLAWVEELGKVNFDLTSYPAVEEAGSRFTKFWSSITTKAGQILGNFSGYAQTLAPMVQIIAGAIPIMTTLSTATWAQTLATNAWTVATKLLGTTFYGIPIIGWIAAIVAAIAWVVSSTEGWGKAWDHTFKGMKLLVGAFVEFVKGYFNTLVNGIMIAIDKIKKGWFQFKKAVGIGNDAENQAMIDQLDADVENRKTAIKKSAEKVVEKSAGAAAEFVQAAQSIKWKKDPKATAAGVNDLVAPEKLSFDTDTTTNGKSNGKGAKNGADGLNVGGGTNGIKSIAQTLNITNNFSVSKDTNIRDLADKVVTYITDGLRDGIVNLG